jgi:hypothetical protein
MATHPQAAHTSRSPVSVKTFSGKVLAHRNLSIRVTVGEIFALLIAPDTWADHRAKLVAPLWSASTKKGEEKRNDKEFSKFGDDV